MGFINQGSQFITFDFKHKAKGSDFNKLNRTVIRPGIYSGLKITYVGNNVLIGTGTTVFNCAYGIDDNLQVKVNFDSIYDYGTVNPTTLGQNEILYLEYEYGEVTENYADFKHTSYGSFDFDNENLVIIGELLYDLSYNISSVSYTNKTFGLNSADLNYAIPDNTRYYNISDETKFFKLDGSKLSSGTRKINLPNFSESEGELLITTATNTVQILNDINVSGTTNLRNTNIVGNGDLSYTASGSLTLANANINGQGNINLIGDASFTNLNVSQDITLGRNISIDGFLNTAETTNTYFLNLVAGTTATANFDNSDVVFLTLQSGSATTVNISIPELNTGKWRQLYIYVTSNGNYSFSNTTVQGFPLVWKSLTANTVGSQPTWSSSGTVDGHNFIFDGTKLYHIHTFQYIVTIIIPTNLNYSGNTFDLFAYETYNLTPTLSGTSPFIFTAQTTLPSEVSLNSGTGVISIYRTNSLSATNYTIRATNSSGFTERIVSLRFNFSLGNLSKGSATVFFPSSFIIQSSFNQYYYGFRKRSFSSTLVTTSTFPAIGSLTNEKFANTNIEVMQWVDARENSFGSGTKLFFNLFINGNVTGVPWTTITYGTESFSKSSGEEFYSSDTQFIYSIPVTTYSWNITLTQFNYFQANNNLQYRII